MLSGSTGWSSLSSLPRPSRGGAGIHVFSFMTSFTHCSGTSFTLPRERSEGGSKPALSKEGKDGLGDERYW